MPIFLAAITVVIQACFIYHVFKTRHPYWWAFIILSFPVIGKRGGGDQAFMQRVTHDDELAWLNLTKKELG